MNDYTEETNRNNVFANSKGFANHDTWLASVWFRMTSLDEVETARKTLEDAYGDAPNFLRDFIRLSGIDWDNLRAHVSVEEETES